MSSLRPQQALLHPAWLGALAVLVLNDHVLKGADLFPGLVTGKLSDLAGLVVAPVLLAVLLRVRTERGLLRATIATGLVFSALQLSTGFAAGWDGMMTAVGVPWRTFSDPTDLIALPMLAVGWFVLVPSMAPCADHRRSRVARTLLGGTALLACVATSRGPGEFLFFAESYLLNDTDEELEVYLRALKPDVLTTCAVLAEDPGSLPPELFAMAEGWALSPHETLPLDVAPVLDDNCRILLVEIAGLPSVVLYWEEGDLERRDIEPMYRKLDAAPNGGIAVLADEDGGLSYAEKELDALHIARPADPGVDGVCDATEDSDRLFFDLEDMGNGTILAVEPGLDGCIGLALERDSGSTLERFLCVPEEMFPFEVGDVLSIDLAGEDTWSQRLDLTTDDGRRLLVAIGSERPVLDRLSLEGESDTCTAAVQDSCGTLARTGGVWAGWAGAESTFLVPGEAPAVVDITATEAVTAYLGTFEDRVALDPLCVSGAPLLGADLEIAIRIDPIAQ